MNENEPTLFGQRVIEKNKFDFEVDFGQMKTKIVLTMKIRQTKIDQVRQKIGLAIMKLGCRLAGFSGLEVETNEGPKPPSGSPRVTPPRVTPKPPNKS